MNSPRSAAPPLLDLVSRLRSIGVRGVVKAVLSRLPVTIYLHERHHWLEFDLRREQPEIPMPEGFALTSGKSDDLGALDEMGSQFSQAANLLESGQELFVVRHGDRPAFTAWIYHGTMPTNAIPGGWLTLPPTYLNLEDSIANPDFRGRGLAPASWSAIMADVRRRHPGAERVFTIILEDNVVTRGGTSKAGFRGFAVVDIVKFGVGPTTRRWRERQPDGPFLRSRVRVERYVSDNEKLPESDAADELSGWLRSELDSARR